MTAPQASDSVAVFRLVCLIRHSHRGWRVSPCLRKSGSSRRQIQRTEPASGVVRASGPEGVLRDCALGVARVGGRRAGPGQFGRDAYVLNANGIKAALRPQPPLHPFKGRLVCLSGSLPVVGHFFYTPFHHGDLVSHFCDILLEIRDEDKSVELLEASLFLAPASRVVRERGRRIRLLSPLSTPAALRDRT